MDTAHEVEQHAHHVDVTVLYVGEKPFHRSLAGDTTFGQVKLEAMKKFELEPSSAPKYQLLFGESALTESGTLSSLDLRKVELELKLKNEVPKG